MRSSPESWYGVAFRVPSKIPSMSATRNNHYVPRWYQAGFFEPGRATLAYFDLTPPQKTIDDGRVITGNSLVHWPTERCFQQRDLYSTFFGTLVNDEIERRLTFICGRSRRGNFQLQRKTRRDRMRGKLRDIKAELRRRMHQPIPEQGKWLRQVVAGHFAYYAVPTNSRALSAFRHYVTDLWRRTLRRRSQKGGFTWERMTKLVADWLPPPRILHPWPDQRFDVRHPR